MNISELFNVSNKVILITGGGSGIGKMMAEGFVRNGANVYIASRKCSKNVADMLNKIGPGKCSSFICDITSKDSLIELRNYINEKENGKLHVLINNSGTNYASPFDQYPTDAFDKVIAVNVRGIFATSQIFISLLQNSSTPNDPSRIINIGSVDGLYVGPIEMYAYSASKAAVHQLTRVMANHLGDRNITVNAIAAGPFPSRMMNSTLEKSKDLIEQSTILKRIGEPKDMIGCVLYLSSSAGAFITGSIIVLDGGISIKSHL